jgi:putative ABC transport system permease protein
MTVHDIVAISTGNLWRMKLRTFLTTAGVLIAIAAFVAMLSFGAGNQQHLEEEFNKLGLFTTMQVYPRSSRENSDSTPSPVLDYPALKRIAAIDGVNLVYPYDAFPATVRVGDSCLTTKAQALPVSAVRTRLFSNLAAGSAFDDNSAHQALVSREFLKRAGIPSPDSALGRPVIVSVRVSSVDSGLAHILVDHGETLHDRLRRIRLDSLLSRRYRSRVIRAEADEALRRFLHGFLNSQRTISDTLVIHGVLGGGRIGRTRTEPLILPAETAARFNEAGLSGSPAEMLAAMSRGTLFAQPDGHQDRTFPSVTIDFDPRVFYKTIKDSVEALGFRTFSFAEQFEEIQRLFLYFDLALGIIGLIALTTASLGIVNTMVMSISERRREIGVLKSLGAREQDIRLLFLAESGLIGLLGTTTGLLTGWVLTRIVSALAQAYMRNQGVPVIDLFALPGWLVMISLGVGVGVSVLAGFYPAARAARIDPVEALRND